MSSKTVTMPKTFAAIIVCTLEWFLSRMNSAMISICHQLCKATSTVLASIKVNIDSVSEMCAGYSNKRTEYNIYNQFEYKTKHEPKITKQKWSTISQFAVNRIQITICRASLLCERAYVISNWWLKEQQFICYLTLFMKKKKKTVLRINDFRHCTLFEFFIAFSAWIFKLIAMCQHMRFVCANLCKWFATDNTLVWPFVCMNSAWVINRTDFNWWFRIDNRTVFCIHFFPIRIHFPKNHFD